MKRLLSLALALAATAPLNAGASPPLPDESIAVLRAALPACRGGWDEYARTGIERISPASLAPRLDLLARPRPNSIGAQAKICIR